VEGKRRKRNNIGTYGWLVATVLVTTALLFAAALESLTLCGIVIPGGLAS